jgi:peptidoglycan/xylan/chitin deacetylase (PgdA/CDA1 family)
MKDQLNFVTNWADIKPNNSKSILRHYMLDILSQLEKARNILNTSTNVPRVHFLYFHHIFLDEVKGFRMILEWLVDKGFEFISHSEAVNKIALKEYEGMYVSISFDDGLKSCLLASKIMDDYGAKGCFYINGKVISASDNDKIETFCREQLNMKLMEFLSWEDIKDMVKRGHEIGNHTFSHNNCGKLSQEDFENDFEINHRLISEKITPPVHFAWPYGREDNVNKGQLDYIKMRGYHSAASAIRGGCYHEGRVSDSFYLLREHCVAAWPLRHIEYFISRSCFVSTDV